MKKTIETSIEINAPPQKVWNILLKNNEYTDWNPFIQSIDGVIKEDNTITVALTPPGGGSFKFKPVVLKASFPEFRWKGKFLFTGLFDGEHYFRIEEISPNVSRLVHGENFSGILVGLMVKTLINTEAGFELMNKALKKRSEL